MEPPAALRSVAGCVRVSAGRQQSPQGCRESFARITVVPGRRQVAGYCSWRPDRWKSQNAGITGWLRRFSRTGLVVDSTQEHRILRNVPQDRLRTSTHSGLPGRLQSQSASGLPSGRRAAAWKVGSRVRVISARPRTLQPGAHATRRHAACHRLLCRKPSSGDPARLRNCGSSACSRAWPVPSAVCSTGEMTACPPRRTRPVRGTCGRVRTTIGIPGWRCTRDQTGAFRTRLPVSGRPIACRSGILPGPHDSGNGGLPLHERTGGETLAAADSEAAGPLSSHRQ